MGGRNPFRGDELQVVGVILMGIAIIVGIVRGAWWLIQQAFGW